jgi:hypothetical protein
VGLRQRHGDARTGAATVSFTVGDQTSPSTTINVT